jgi:hypothetical protein
MPNVRRAVLLIALVTVGLIVAPAEADECNGAPQGTVTLAEWRL